MQQMPLFYLFVLPALPAPAGTTGKNQAALCHRKPHFLGIHNTIKMPKFCPQQIGQHRRLQARGIGIDQNSGLSVKRFTHSLTSGWIASSIFQISPLGPLP